MVHQEDGPIILTIILWLSQLHGMLIRHPEYFYVSRKGSRHTVFLREAFEEIHVSGNRKEYGLIDKHPLVLVKEKLAALMEVNQPESASS